MADADGPFQYRGIAAIPSPAIELIGGDTISERLRSAVAAIDGRIMLTTSFGREAQLIAHHVFTERLPIEVVTLDTGRHFPETYNVWQATEERYGVRIPAFYPEADAVRAMVADSGINGFYYSKDARLACCHVRKVEPLKRALAGASAWMTGLRADQSRHRSSVSLAGWDAHRALIKLAPLFDWTARKRRGRMRAARSAGERAPCAGLSVDRMRAVHACGQARRTRARRTLVVGTRRDEGMRSAHGPRRTADQDESGMSRITRSRTCRCSTSSKAAKRSSSAHPPPRTGRRNFSPRQAPKSSASATAGAPSNSRARRSPSPNSSRRKPLRRRRARGGRSRQHHRPARAQRRAVRDDRQPFADRGRHLDRRRGADARPIDPRAHRKRASARPLGVGQGGQAMASAAQAQARDFASRRASGSVSSLPPGRILSAHPRSDGFRSAARIDAAAEGPRHSGRRGTRRSRAADAEGGARAAVRDGHPLRPPRRTRRARTRAARGAASPSARPATAPRASNARSTR